MKAVLLCCRRLCSLSSKSTRRDPVLCFVSSSSPCRSNKLRAWSRGATHMQQPGGVSDLASSFRFPEQVPSSLMTLGRMTIECSGSDVMSPRSCQ
jgi:hypothetical protein